MIKNRLSVCLALIIGLSPLWGQASLSEQLDSLIQKNLPRGSEVGVCVYDLTRRQELYTYRADKLARPASNMKVLTVATALEKLKDDDAFRTEVWYQGTLEQDTLKGDLYVVGGFDPRFNEEALDTLVAQIGRFPFSVFQGKIYGDVSMKDSLYWGSGWLWDDTPAAFQPYMSPLMLNKGTVSLQIIPAEPGEPAVIISEPTSSFYTLINETQSHTFKAGKLTVSRNWLENGNEIIVSGNVENTRNRAINIYPSHDFLMHILTEKLSAKNPTFPNNYEYSVLQKDSTATPMAHWESSLQEVIKEVMKESDNLGAEALLCKLAVRHTGKKNASWEDGLIVVRQFIEKLGHHPEHYKIADGSGLSNYNYITPALLVDILKYIYADTRMFQRFYRSLPIGGIDGTLAYRMRKGTRSYKNVHAKTGTVTGISSLAGYLKAGNGNDIAFAIMNQNGLKASEARKLQDEICELLCK